MPFGRYFSVRRSSFHESCRRCLVQGHHFDAARYDCHHHQYLVRRRLRRRPGGRPLRPLLAHPLQAGTSSPPATWGRFRPPAGAVLLRHGRGGAHRGGTGPVQPAGEGQLLPRHRGVHLRALRGGLLQQVCPRRRPGGGRQPGQELQPPIHSTGSPAWARPTCSTPSPTLSIRTNPACRWST